MSQDSEAPAVAVVETQALPGELGLQNAILLTQKRDDVRLLTIEPAAQGSDQQLERVHGRSHAMALIQLWDITATSAARGHAAGGEV
jgi:hypothetical protein